VERAARFLRHPATVIIAVTILGGWLRFSGLATPHELVFDETYYAKDACIYLSKPVTECGLKSPYEQSWVHPPLGKWMIAGGEAAFGHRSFGWRFSSALAGTATVGLTALLSFVLFGSTLWAGAAGLLLATENLHFVQSRMAMLDVFLTLFVVCGFLFLVLDRRWIERRTSFPPGPSAGPEPSAEVAPAPASLGPGAMAAREFAPAAVAAPPGPVPSPLLRPWRMAAGVGFGAATASKWSGVLGMLGGIVLAFAWEVSRRRRAGRPRPVRESLTRESLGILLSLVLVPILVYVAASAVWLKQHGWSPRDFIRNQEAMFRFHRDLDTIKSDGQPIHPYLSPAWSWFLLKRPVAYYYQGTDTTAAEIIGMGNPAIFWGMLIALPAVLAAWWRRRDWVAGFVAVTVLAQYVPWLAVARPLFLFYLTPAVPFMVLAAVYALRSLARVRLSTGARPYAPVAGLLVLISVGLFVFFHPILVGDLISKTAWQARIWFGSWV
jgi:dolichyl-phosphate-mannose-protein mannosyltransferase